MTASKRKAKRLRQRMERNPQCGRPVWSTLHLFCAALIFRSMLRTPLKITRIRGADC
jgi:hypothetical protein